ncbi:hypothetical protein AVEN_137336-1 [Araneus ventricosus]|uniref:Uncharacterized protein n=1 Tax=Araneus ventricosus TaxID=182803 RepID=A0A4Y2FIK3_ARAVE|nr:hypothetical protein AVEN_137336-1 [Araneus ventricosus]
MDNICQHRKALNSQPEWSPGLYSQTSLEAIYLLPFYKPELEERRVSCLQNCRPGCLKLHYNNKIKEDKLQSVHCCVLGTHRRREISDHVLGSIGESDDSPMLPETKPPEER